MEEDKNQIESYAEKFEREKKEREEKFKKLEAEFLVDLKTNPRYIPFFEPFSIISVENFKMYYSHRKAELIVYGKNAIDNEDQSLSRYSQMAGEKIWEIQQEKLLRLNFKWNAELIKIKEVDTTWDFDYWSLHIVRCPFIPAITQEEFDEYMDYIKSSTFEEIKYEPALWQDIESYKSQYLSGSTEEYYGDGTPYWYRYNEKKRGLADIYKLPYIRGDKEEFYSKLYFEEQEKGKEKKNIVKNDQDDRPYLSAYDNEQFEEFIKLFEDNRLLRIHRAFEKDKERDTDSELNEALKVLQPEPVNIEIRYNKDWRQGLIEAANEYQKKRLIEELSKSYKKYLFRINAGLQFEENDSSENLDYATAFHKKIILQGRALNNEPEDFNF